MEEKIRNMIAEYASKVSDCDVLIEKYGLEKNHLRNKIRNGDSSSLIMNDMALVKQRESVAITQRQCYFQTVHDLDSLLDHLEA